jgi:hypothetical protein
MTILWFAGALALTQGGRRHKAAPTGGEFWLLVDKGLHQLFALPKEGSWDKGEKNRLWIWR